MTSTPLPDGLTILSVDRNDDNAMADLPGSTGWEVTLGFEDREMTVPFTMGSSFNRPPMLSEVIEALASEAAAVVNDEPDDEATPEELAATADQCAELQILLGGSFDAVVFPTLVEVSA